MLNIRHLLIACAAFAATGGASAKEAPCKPMSGWEAVAKASAGKFLIFGETHGTVEGPASVAEFVCAVAGKGRPVLLAVELNAPANAAMQAAWRSRTLTPAELRSALFDVFGGVNSGNGSDAMMDMLLSLHDLKRRGADIDVVAFNGARDDAQRAKFAHLPPHEPHEAAQAENIQIAAAARDYGYVVVLVGDAHARKQVIQPFQQGGSPYQPMAMKLASAERIVSLRMRTSGGQAWKCIPKPESMSKPPPYTIADMDCGPHGGPASAEEDAPESMMVLDADGVYDGFFFVGGTHASPPARRDP